MALSKVGTPEYINFLLSPNTPLDFHVNVGDPWRTKPEKIKAVRWMLIARSKVLRVMLLESKMKESSGFNITDLDPTTFKHFLTYLYGHDNTSALHLEDSIKLLNAAEKYDVEDLKDTLGSQIEDRLTEDNVFTVLKYPQVCEQVAPLWETTTKIIQSKTDDMFANEQFVGLSLESMLFILQQDTLSVEEIDIWGAALRWARHQGQLQGQEDSPEMIREFVLPLLKHIRLCTLSFEQISSQVITTNVLTLDEMGKILISLSKQEKSESLSFICKEIQKRGFVTSIQTYFNKHPYKEVVFAMPTFFALIKNCSLQLCSLTCEAGPKPVVDVMTPQPPDTVQCQGDVTISRVTNYDNNTSSEPPVTVSFSQQVRYGEQFEIPLTQDNLRVVLQPNNKYAVDITFPSHNPCSLLYSGSLFPDQTTCFNMAYVNVDGCGYGSNMASFKYKVLHDSSKQVT